MRKRVFDSYNLPERSLYGCDSEAASQLNQLILKNPIPANPILFREQGIISYLQLPPARYLMAVSR